MMTASLAVKTAFCHHCSALRTPLGAQGLTIAWLPFILLSIAALRLGKSPEMKTSNIFAALDTKKDKKKSKSSKDSGDKKKKEPSEPDRYHRQINFGICHLSFQLWKVALSCARCGLRGVHWPHDITLCPQSSVIAAAALLRTGQACSDQLGRH